jgi:hypothetical protein
VDKEIDTENLEALIAKCYLEPGKGRTKNTIPHHQVLKGLTYILVWNCTGNGVKPSIYTPSFHLETGGTLFRRIENNIEQDDFDVAEEFHKYVLHNSEKPYHGVIVPVELCNKRKDAERIMCWTVPPFGWTSSPYFTLRMLARDIELSTGN